MTRALALACLAGALALGLAASARAQGARVQGSTYTLFWRGDFRVIATQPGTRVTLIDAATGGLLDPATYTSAIRTNPFVLSEAGDSFEANNASVTFRVRVEASLDAVPSQGAPVIVWTGSIPPTFKHPSAPPVTSNAWVSNVPALAPGSVENGTEIGREFWGFTTREMYLFARRGPSPTVITIEDVATNVDADTDDSQVLGPASPALVHQDGEIEIYYLDQFEDDTFHVTANVDVSLTVGIGSQDAPDWETTPPSWGLGEDSRELGTLFYAFVGRELSVFPTQDDTTVEITDLSDGDDDGTYVLAEGDLGPVYDILFTDPFARNFGGVASPRPANPQVRLTLMGANAPFENDFVRVRTDKPVLVYVGPKASDQGEYADVAYAVRSGPSSWLTYCYAQNGGADDLQLFALDPETRVNITSLTYHTGTIGGRHHDFSIPDVSPWIGGNPITSDWFWSNGEWSAEVLRVESDGPVTVIGGDYDGWNFGCFIPFMTDTGLLRPIAIAGPDQAVCPGTPSVTLDGSGSFDGDAVAGSGTPSWTWDTSAAVDTDGDGNATNDADLTGPIVTFPLTGPGPWVVTLTYVDDDLQSDTDFVVIASADAAPPAVSCPSRLDVAPDAPDGAFVSLGATATDDCGPVVLANDRTTGGADASGRYPCGETRVTFTATDAAGRAAACTTTVAVRPPGPPSGMSPALRVDPTDGRDARLGYRLHWEPFAVQPWQWLQVRGTLDWRTRPYPVIDGGPWLQGSEWIEPAPAGPPGAVRYYQVHVADCTGAEAPDPLALSP